MSDAPDARQQLHNGSRFSNAHSRFSNENIRSRQPCVMLVPSSRRRISSQVELSISSRLPCLRSVTHSSHKPDRPLIPDPSCPRFLPRFSSSTQHRWSLAASARFGGFDLSARSVAAGASGGLGASASGLGWPPGAPDSTGVAVGAGATVSGAGATVGGAGAAACVLVTDSGGEPPADVGCASPLGHPKRWPAATKTTHRSFGMMPVQRKDRRQAMSIEVRRASADAER